MSRSPRETPTQPGRPTLQSASGRFAPNKWLVLATVGLGTYLSVLDSSVVNASLPTITRELGTDVTIVQWVVMGYLLTITGLLLSFGRLADLVGRKKVYVAGMIIFTACTALCGASLSIEQLIALRVVQGVGSAMVMAISPAITATAFGPGERGKALGINATIVAVGGISGPVLGGMLTDLMDWRWVFFFRAPFGVLATVLAAYILLDEPGVGRRRIDIVGGALLFGWLAALTIGLNQGSNLGWTSPTIVLLLLAALVGLAAFVFVELRVREPMLDLQVFRNRLFSAASVSSLLSFMANFAVAFLMPFYLVEALGYSPGAAGLMLIPQPIVMSIVAPLSGLLSDRIGSRLLSSTGLAIACVGLLSIGNLSATSTYLEVAACLATVGLGVGLFQSPNNNALLGSVPPSRIGIASGMLATMRNLGMVVGTAVAGAVWTSRMAYHSEVLAALGGLDAPTLHVQAFVGGFHDAFVVSAIICSIGVFASLVRGSHRRSEALAGS